MTPKPPTRSDLLALLAGQKQRLADRYGVTRLGLFGSFARDEGGAESDVDIVLGLKTPDLFAMVHIKEELEAELQRPVDLIHYRERMNAFLKERIDREARYV